MGVSAAWRSTHGTHWQQVAASSSGPVHVSVRLAAASGGTRLHLRLSGVRSGQRCSLVAVSRNGRTEVAGWWVASYSGAAEMTGTTSIARADLARLEVVTDAGKTLAVVPVHA